MEQVGQLEEIYLQLKENVMVMVHKQTPFLVVVLQVEQLLMLQAYNGSSWTTITSLPAGRFGAAGAGNSSALVLSGGAPNSGTLEWNGT
jgi:hypothetical protein